MGYAFSGCFLLPVAGTRPARQKREGVQVRNIDEQRFKQNWMETQRNDWKMKKNSEYMSNCSFLYVFPHSLSLCLQGICFSLHEAFVWASSWWLRDICRWRTEGRSVQATCADPHRSHEPGEKKGPSCLFRINYISHIRTYIRRIQWITVKWYTVPLRKAMLIILLVCVHGLIDVYT